MILLKANKEKYHILSENSDRNRLLQLLEDCTTLNEINQEYFVSEEIHDTIIIRDFACKEKGYLYSLIICDGVATKIETVQHG